MPPDTTRMTGDDYRGHALAMQDAIERAHMGHPDFRANGRIFATLMADERSGGLKLTPAEQRALMRAHPKTFHPASGAWGRSGWTMVRLPGADEAAVRGAIVLAWENVMAMPPARPRPKRTATRKSGVKRSRRT
jgi:hypothetical protein